MHVKSNASSSPTAHVGAPASAGSAKSAKAGNGGADFTKMLNDAKAGAPASAATAPMAAAPAVAAGASTLATPASTLSLDTASLAARG
ncbi:hypothetical protein [Roseateles chitinivorans]|uniref:hypothetical protein n=1 Tax=Roseateles chitinivorans TaxID=2917965 RepID=UPI003D676ADE